MSEFWYCVKHHAVEEADGAARRSTASVRSAPARRPSTRCEKAEQRNEAWDNDPDWNDEA